MGNFVGGRKGTLIVAWIYLVIQFIIAPVKLILTAYIVFGGEAASWSLNKIGSLYVGEFVDQCWFICNAVIPLIIAMIRTLSEPSLTVEIDCPACVWSGQELVHGEDENEVFSDDKAHDDKAHA